MSSWRNCIVTYIDLVGISEFASQRDKKASSLMRTMHRCVSSTQFSKHHRVYVWNDSVLLLAYLDKKSDYNAILGEADNLTWHLDKIAKSYAISVKGRAFPVHEKSQDRVTIIEASSWALSNCFEIEKAARKNKWNAK